VRLLLDSHVVLWWLVDDERLGSRASKAIAEADTVAFSVVTPWELGVKQQRGKIDLPDGYLRPLLDQGFAVVPISLDHVEEVSLLPAHHRDPFDRMLIAQARLEAMTLVSADSAFADYDVELLAADR
jgi:PIN domain nuclease of toxin-antitoxin system